MGASQGQARLYRFQRDHLMEIETKQLGRCPVRGINMWELSNDGEESPSTSVPSVLQEGGEDSLEGESGGPVPVNA